MSANKPRKAVTVLQVEEKVSYAEDMRFVRAFARGGKWEIALRIARRALVREGQGQRNDLANNVGKVTHERHSLRDIAKDTGLAQKTVQKYLATWEWAAGDGWVDPSDELSLDSEYDWGDDSGQLAEWKERWKEYYDTAMLNPPPWNPQGKPLEPRLGPERNTAKANVLTEETVKEALRSDPKLAREVIKDAIVSNPAASRVAREALAEADRDEAWEELGRRADATAARERQRSGAFMRISGSLVGVVRSLRQAFKDADGATLSDDERELLGIDVGRVRALLGLLEMRVTGEVEVDWDAELAKISGGAA